MARYLAPWHDPAVGIGLGQFVARGDDLHHIRVFCRRLLGIGHALGAVADCVFHFIRSWGAGLDGTGAAHWNARHIAVRNGFGLGLP